MSEVIHSFQSQLSGVMETVFKAAIFEISRLVEDSFVKEVSRSREQVETLKKRLQWSETRRKSQETSVRSLRCAECDKARVCTEETEEMSPQSENERSLKQEKVPDGNWRSCELESDTLLGKERLEDQTSTSNTAESASTEVRKLDCVLKEETLYVTAANKGLQDGWTLDTEGAETSDFSAHSYSEQELQQIQEEWSSGLDHTADNEAYVDITDIQGLTYRTRYDAEELASYGVHELDMGDLDGLGERTEDMLGNSVSVAVGPDQNDLDQEGGRHHSSSIKSKRGNRGSLPVQVTAETQDVDGDMHCLLINADGHLQDINSFTEVRSGVAGGAGHRGHSLYVEDTASGAVYKGHAFNHSLKPNVGQAIGDSRASAKAFPVAHRTRLSAVMETVLKTTMYEITRLVEQSFLEQMDRGKREAEVLKRRLIVSEAKLRERERFKRVRCVDCGRTAVSRRRILHRGPEAQSSLDHPLVVKQESAPDNSWRCSPKGSANQEKPSAAPETTQNPDQVCEPKPGGEVKEEATEARDPQARLVIHPHIHKQKDLPGSVEENNGLRNTDSDHKPGGRSCTERPVDEDEVRHRNLPKWFDPKTDPLARSSVSQPEPVRTSVSSEPPGLRPQVGSIDSGPVKQEVVVMLPPDWEDMERIRPPVVSAHNSAKKTQLDLQPGDPLTTRPQIQERVSYPAPPVKVQNLAPQTMQHLRSPVRKNTKIVLHPNSVVTDHGAVNVDRVQPICKALPGPKPSHVRQYPEGAATDDTININDHNTTIIPSFFTLFRGGFPEEFAVRGSFSQG
ncbi:hypothetical protein G5714_000561 [Onychostoma macrolepis]|uniref:Uncharacterized protein n=1 Tax=Onychostoma macrolepis TaxID=369639 RepID=A0A7J6DGV1_9TELE|nr:hypothetical protein G5714_000561 [Onychostoma macrolepis]